MADKTKLRIRYEQHELSPLSARVYLNDMDISGRLIGFKIVGSVDHVTQVELSVYPDAIEIDAETLATLTAIVDSRKDKS